MKRHDVGPCLAVTLLVSACAPHPVPRAPSANPLQAGPNADQTTRAWKLLAQTLRGTWGATTSSGAKLTEGFRLVSNDTVLVETFGTPGGRETISVYHLDRGTLMMTHYCGQGNQPRLRAAVIEDDAIVFRFVDATNVLPDQDLLVEKRLRLGAGTFEQTEVYRQTDGKLDTTVFHFSPSPAPGEPLTPP